MNNLQYEWAIQTKHAGDTRDYRILAQTPGEISDKDFDRIFRSLSLGELPGGMDPYTPPAPWLAFGFFAGAKAHYLACVRQDWTDQQDARSRQISYASCLCVPFEQIAERQLTLVQIARLQDALNLNEVLRQITSSNSDSVLNLECVDLLPEEPAPQLAATAAKIDENGFDYCASVAATLLQTPVVLVRGKPGWEESLSQLETVLSLLPYGARAFASFGSWTRTATIHSIRLSFSSAASRDKEYIPWAPQVGTSRQALPEKMHQAYFNMLLEAHKRHTTEEIVEHLLGSIAPQNFDSPEPFLTTLQFLDRPYLILQRIKELQNMPNVALLADIRDLLESDQAHQLGQMDRQKMLRYLLRAGSDRKSAAVLAKNWKNELHSDFFERADQEFLNKNHLGLQYCADIARGVKQLEEELFDHFLQSEFVSNKTSRSTLIQWVRKTLWLNPEFARSPLLALLTLKPFPPEFAMDWAQDLFIDNPGDEQDRKIFKILCASTTFAHRSLRIVLRLQEDVLELETLTELNRTNPENAPWLFDFAIKTKSFKNVSTAFSQWALQNVSRPSQLEFQSVWESRLKKVDGSRQDDLVAVSCANYDVVWLNFSGNRQPTWLWLALHSKKEAFEDYTSTFAASVGLPGLNTENLINNLDAALNLYIQHSLPAAEAKNLDLFVGDINTFLKDERLYMTQQKNRLREYLKLPRSTKDVALCCANILNDRRLKDSPELILSQLIELRYSFTTSGAVDELVQQITLQAPDRAQEFKNKLIASILDGHFGSQLATTYRQRRVDSLLQDIDLLVQNINLLDPKDPAYRVVTEELDRKLGKYLPKKGLFGGR